MVNCSVLQCKNTRGTKNRASGGISYHRFPKDPHHKEKWIDATGRRDWFPTKNCLICSEHFLENDFVCKGSTRRFLTETAVPSQNIYCIKKNASKTTSESDDAEEMELWVLEDDESIEHEDPQVAIDDVKSVEGPSQANLDHVKFVVLANDDTTQREGFSQANIEDDNPMVFVNDNNSKHKDPQANIEEVNSEVFVNDNTVEYKDPLQANIEDETSMLFANDNTSACPSQANIEDIKPIICENVNTSVYDYPQANIEEVTNDKYEKSSQADIDNVKPMKNDILSAMNIPKVPSTRECQHWTRTDRIIMMFPALFDNNHPQFRNKKLVNSYRSQLLEKLESERKKYSPLEEPITNETIKTKLESFKRKLKRRRQSLQINASKRTSKPDTAEDTWVLEDDETLEHEDPRVAVKDVKSVEGPSQANIDHVKFVVLANDDTTQRKGPSKSNIEDANPKVFLNDNTTEHKDLQANIKKVNSEVFVNDNPLQANIKDENSMILANNTIDHENPQANKDGKLTILVNNYTFEYIGPLQAKIEDVNPVFANDSTSVYEDPQANIEEVKEEVFVNDETYECPSEADIEDTVFENDNNSVYEDPLQANIEDVKPVVACRGCLVTEQPLRPLDHKLGNAYGLLISTVEQNDIYPKYICTYCRALLLRFTSFREKCLSAQAALDKIHSEGTQLTLDLIQGIQKPAYPLQTQTILISFDDQNQYSTNNKQDSDSCTDNSEHNDCVLTDSSTQLEHDFIPTYSEHIDKGGTANEHTQQVTDLPQDFESEIGKAIICKAPQDFLSTIEGTISENIFESTPSTSEQLIDLLSVKIPLEQINEDIEENYVQIKNSARDKLLKNKLEGPNFARHVKIKPKSEVKKTIIASSQYFKKYIPKSPNNAPYYVKIKPIHSEVKETNATTFQEFKKISKSKRLYQSNRDNFNLVKIAPKPTQSVPKSSKSVVMDNSQTVHSATKSEDTTTYRTQTKVTLNDIMERINDIEGAKRMKLS